MEKLPHYNFSWTVSLQNRTQFGRGYGPVARQTNRRKRIFGTFPSLLNFDFSRNPGRARAPPPPPHRRRPCKNYP
jgi:hypothetical protein